jgi:hypothetical protein
MFEFFLNFVKFWKFWPFMAIWLADWKWNLVSGWTTLKHRIDVVFRTDLHKMKINTELCCKRYDFLTKNTQTIVIRIIVLDDNIQIYLYGLLCEHVLSMRTVHKFIKYEKRLRKEGKNIFANSARVWTRSTSLSSF